MSNLTSAIKSGKPAKLTIEATNPLFCPLLKQLLSNQGISGIDEQSGNGSDGWRSFVLQIKKSEKFTYTVEQIQTSR